MSHRHTDLFSRSQSAPLCQFTNTMQRSIIVHCRPFLLLIFSSVVTNINVFLTLHRPTFKLFTDWLWLDLVNRIMHLRIP